VATIGFRVKLGLWSGTGEDVAMVISGGASIRGGMCGRANVQHYLSQQQQQQQQRRITSTDVIARVICPCRPPSRSFYLASRHCRIRGLFTAHKLN